MISAEAAEGLVQDTDAPLHNDYLVKPINMPSLLKTLAYHLNIELKTADEPEAVPLKKEDNSKNDPLVISELLSSIEIGYLEGFKQTLALAKQQGSINLPLCDRLYQCLETLDMAQIRTQLMSLKDEIKS
jgi:hypothetical protein